MMHILKTIFSLIFFLNIYLLPQTFLTNSVVAGGVTSNSARFWVRISEAGMINVEAAADPTFSFSLKGVPVNVTPESNFAGIVNISGLQPNTNYYYRVLINDAVRDTINRYFQTFPETGVSSEFSFAFGSCQRGDGNVFNEIVKHQPRFFLQLGDWGYPDTTDNIPYDNNFFSASYSTVQATYTYKFDQSYPMDSLFKIAPVDYVYDDHDYMNNDASATTSSFTVPVKPNSFGDDFVAMDIPNPEGARENSIRGYIENFPGYSLENESRGIYHKFSFGNIEIFALDLRSQRSPNQEALVKNNSTGLWEFNPPEGHSILGTDNSPGSGENQLDWFLNSLLNSDAEWKFIMSSVPFNKSQKTAIDLGISLQNTVLIDGINGIFAAMELADKWVGFYSDIDTLLNFISANKIKNLIVLSGDSHTSAIDDGTNAGLPEIMAGGLDITNSRLVALFLGFGLNIWNKGGQGLTTSEFNDAFGKVTVYGSDSVKLSLIDEFGTEFAKHTIYDNEKNGSPNLPVEYELYQNYPNPFNPFTTISFSVPDEGIVSLKVYNILGQQIKTLLNEQKESGLHKIIFDAESLPSGIYFYKIECNSFSDVKKMVVLK